jgi:hypothetical protein
VVGALDISARHVGRLAQEVGAELAQARDAQAEQRRRRQLLPRVAAPAVAAVEVDGGRLRTRQPGCGPGVHQPQHKEDKVACLVSLASTTHAEDPQPEPPPSFQEPPRVARLVQRLCGQSGAPAPESPRPEEAPPDEPAAAADRPGPDREGYPAAPRRLARTCVATMQNSRAFGPMVAGEAQARNLYAAGRRAFLGDGQAYNWKIQRGYFRDFEPITDFIHVLCYVYRAAWAVGSSQEERWARYLGWMAACWQGRVAEVVSELAEWVQRLGPGPPEGPAEEQQRRQVLAESLRYLRNNQKRMDYPRYRQQGLPVTSSLVESLVGEFNDRVKGPQKYWNRPTGAETILQVRAALLSDDDRLGRHLANRPGNPYRRRRRPQGSPGQSKSQSGS